MSRKARVEVTVAALSRTEEVFHQRQLHLVVVSEHISGVVRGVCVPYRRAFLGLHTLFVNSLSASDVILRHRLNSVSCVLVKSLREAIVGYLGTRFVFSSTMKNSDYKVAI